MPIAFIEKVQEWADVQSLLYRATDADFSLKQSILKKFHVQVLDLFRWYRQRSSSVRTLTEKATAPGVPVLAGLSFLRPHLRSVGGVGEGDGVDATDAGENGSDADLDGIMDHDTETEMPGDGEQDDGQVGNWIVSYLVSFVKIVS